jgi:DNA-binding NtrC family response regulator
VIEPPRGPTILIVDEDVGFVWWLGELFSEFGYRSIPALSSRQALALARKNTTEVHLLVIDPGLRGASRLIQVLRSIHPLKIVLIQESSVREIPGLGVVATLERPSGWAPLSRSEWRQRVQRLLKQVESRAAS